MTGWGISLFPPRLWGIAYGVESRHDGDSDLGHLRIIGLQPQYAAEGAGGTGDRGKTDPEKASRFNLSIRLSTKRWDWPGTSIRI